VANRLRLRHPHFAGAEYIQIGGERTRGLAPGGVLASVENIGRLIRRTAQPSSLGLAHFVADDSANGRSADGSDGAAVRKKGASDGTGPGADGRVLVLSGHPGTTTPADQHCCANRAECEPSLRVHKHS
jgi:hypothetical protein